MHNKFVNLLFVPIISASLCSCSIIGFTIGANQDANTPPSSPVELPHLSGLTIGQTIRAFTSPDDSIQGEYAGTVIRDQVEYTQHYGLAKALLAAKTIWLPNIGESVILSHPKMKSSKLFFLGIDHQENVLISEITKQMRFAYKGRLTSPYIIADEHGNSLDSTAISHIVKSRLIPFASSLLVHTGSRKDTLAIENIVKLEQINSKEKKWTGLAIGVVVDAVALAILASALSFNYGIGGK